MFSLRIKDCQSRIRALVGECAQLRIAPPPGTDAGTLRITDANRQIRRLTTLIEQHKATASTKPTTQGTKTTSRPTPAISSSTASKPAPTEPSEADIRRVQRTGIGSRALARAIARENLKRLHRKH